MEDMDSLNDSNEENNHPDSTQSGSPLGSSQVRKLRYRELLDTVEELEQCGQFGVSSLEKLGDVMQEVSQIEQSININTRYQYAEETLLDATVLSKASALLKKCADEVDSNISTYDPAEFANAILTFMQKDNEEELQDRDILKLQNFTREIIPETIKYAPVFGSYDLNNVPHAKPKKARLTQTKEQFVQKAPKEVMVDKEDEGMDEILKALVQILDEAYKNNNNQPLNYYDYVIDSENFGQTIENMFHVSFLVRDGKVHIDLDSKGDVIIKPMKTSKLRRFRDQNGENSQTIFNMDYDHWEAVKRIGLIERHENQQK